MKLIAHSSGRRAAGFTLIELLVVVGIIVLLVAIAAPAVGPALVSSQRTQVIATLNSSMVAAQTSAIANSTNVGLRIERAFETDEYGQMKRTASGQPLWLNHQIIRTVIYGARRRDATGVPTEEAAFRQVVDTKVIALPSGVWLAPDYALNISPILVDVNPTLVGNRSSTADPVASFRPFETFYIVFSPSGTVTQFPRANLYYLDETQEDRKPASSTYGAYPFIQHVPGVAGTTGSAMGVIVYDRQKLESFGGDSASAGTYLQRDGYALYFNRFLGSTVGGP